MRKDIFCALLSRSSYTHTPDPWENLFADTYKPNM